MSAETEKTLRSPPASGPAAVELTIGELLRLIQGLYAIFWGLLTMAVVGTQMLVRVWLPLLAEAALVGAAAAVAVGAWRLGQVHLASLQTVAVRMRWKRRTLLLRWAAALQLYFAALFCLWWRAPRELYLLANAVAFVFVAIGFLILFNRTIVVLGEVFERSELAWEARLFGLGNIGLLLLPVGALALYVFVAAAVYDMEAVWVLHRLLSRVNWPILIVLLLPFSLTLSLAWAAKDAAARALLTQSAPCESSS